jgi:DNA (cytosine-5)-methyltransferase 1
MPEYPTSAPNGAFNFYEFFAGGGMARAGLGPDWRCLFANDFDHKKSRIYRDNYNNAPELKTGDVGKLTTKDLPGRAELVWASFPCQDLSLAGGGAGLKGERSGTFWPFWNLMKDLIEARRAPNIIALENVCGTLTSYGGKDFATICAALQQADYKFGAVVIDAALFVPHSRPRLFVIAIRNSVSIPAELHEKDASLTWHPRMLQHARLSLSEKCRASWIWWKLPTPPIRNVTFADIIEDQPADVEWHTQEQTKQLLQMMSDVNREKVRDAQMSGKRMVGGVYKRTRHDDEGDKVQRAEIRFDDVSGCLRTPAGGSSRQLIVVVEGDMVRSRLISSRETARLMGLPDEYILPKNYNEAYHLTGDGVVVPVVRHLAANIFEPILERLRSSRAAA